MVIVTPNSAITAMRQVLAHHGERYVLMAL
jgi:hypothetical protein